MAYTYCIGLDTYNPTRVFDLKNLLMSHHKQIIFSKCLIYMYIMNSLLLSHIALDNPTLQIMSAII